MRSSFFLLYLISNIDDRQIRFPGWCFARYKQQGANEYAIRVVSCRFTRIPNNSRTFDNAQVLKLADAGSRM